MAGWRCPECGDTFEDLTAYCPECGARTETTGDFENPEETLTDKI